VAAGWRGRRLWLTTSLPCMRAWELEAEDVLSLPVDELALAILRDVAENQEWNVQNWLQLARQLAYPNRPDVLRALAEAWDWLRMHGLIARDPSQSAPDAFFVTRLGDQAVADGLADARATARLQVGLHPNLERRVRRQYLLGEYDLAAFEAMKQVEVRVRKLIGGSHSQIGVSLMRDAFKSGGPLCDPRMDGGEQVARMELFAGAIGLFKNPTSHREVEFDDPTEASEVVLLGDLLMRILDRIEKELPN
jgi:uncharacterized protein (TIGR02391 family)